MKTLKLNNDDARRAACQQVMDAPVGWESEVRPPKRTAPQNSRYWGKGALHQISQQARINGRRFDSEVWHEYFKKIFLGVIELPDGSVVGKSSTKLSTLSSQGFVKK